MKLRNDLSPSFLSQTEAFVQRARKRHQVHDTERQPFVQELTENEGRLSRLQEVVRAQEAPASAAWAGQHPGCATGERAVSPGVSPQGHAILRLLHLFLASDSPFVANVELAWPCLSRTRSRESDYCQCSERSCTEAARPQGSVATSLLAHTRDAPFDLDEHIFNCNLRSSRRGAVGGPLGMRTEHLRPLVDDMRSLHLFFRVSERLARAQIPEGVVDLLR